MVFSSEMFLFGFLAVVLPLYFLCPKKYRNLVLFLTSLMLFYAWDMPSYALIMLFTITFDYFAGRLIGRFQSADNNKAAKTVMIVTAVVNIGMLAFFKYTNLFIEGVNSLADTGIPLLDITLPIGISFYTFQTMSYVIDVYWRRCEVQKNFIDFGAYVTMFPQLIAGPIVRYVDVEKELGDRRENFNDFGDGVKRFAYGLSKKIIIANAMGEIWEEVSLMPNPPVLTAWIGALAFTFHIFFDFAGYSDMAIGMGKMMGFKFPENFDLPYISRSITEFWRRWHMTLGTWFREYVYIPLGGNRKGRGRQIINLLIVWGLTGFWHGASWNFLLWGLYFGIILILEKLFILKALDRLPRVFSHIYTMLLVVIGWVIFANDDFTRLGAYFKNLVTSPEGLINGYTLFLITSNLVLWLLAVVFSTSLPRTIGEKFQKLPYKKLISTVEVISVTALLIISLSLMVGGGYNPFLYFRF